MKAASTMTRDVVCVPPELPLARAWSLMQEMRVTTCPSSSTARSSAC
jgi:CBS-domain-containing membrane protein